VSAARGRSLGRALAVALGVLVLADAHAQQPPQPAPKATKPAAKAAAKAPPPGVAIEPRAIAILKGTSARLAAAKTMSFTATVTYEYPSLLGPPIAYTTRSAVALQRPDKLLVVTPGDGPASELYYNGKTVMAYTPAEDLVAIAGAPPTIDATLKFLFDATATYYPFTDLIVADPYAAIADGLKAAFYIGRSGMVGGTVTEMVAFASGEVFVQAWIGVDDGLPRRLRATYAKDPQQLRHQLDLSDWQIDQPIAPEKFASSKAAAGKPITFAAPAYQVTRGAKVPLKPRPAAAAQASKSQ